MSTSSLPSIWLVEDSPLEAERACRVLGQGYLVELFPEGSSMLERLAEGPLPDALVLDWHLPGLSGPELCKFVRGSVDEISLPILLLTAASQGHDTAVVEGLQAGANDYVRKPYGAEELVARVRTLVRVSQLHRGAEAQRRSHQQQMQQRIEFEQQLVGIVSHDLRSPLQAILMASTVLSRTAELDELSLRRVHRILDSTHRASALIRDLLDFTKARLGGTLPVTLAPANLHDVVRGAIEEAQHNNPEREISFVAEGEGAAMLDANRFAQVVGNLLANALKYSTPGTPVRVTSRDREGGVNLELEVANEGEVIAPELQSRLFEPFTRGRGSSDIASRSIGLGLYIVKQIVEAHQGTVEVRSSGSRETVFRVVLPRQPSPRQGDAAP